MADIHDEEERRGGFGGPKGADVVFGLATGFDRGVVPSAGATNGLGGLLFLGDAGFLDDKLKLGSGGLGSLELLGFEDEAAAFEEGDAQNSCEKPDSPLAVH